VVRPAPLPPQRAVLTKGRSLGTMAMAHAPEKRFDSDSSDTESLSSRPRYPPPPTAPVVREQRERVYDGVPQPVREMPPLPPPESIPPPIQSPLSRLKARPRTLLQRIEGWWDLGLIEKRQTRFGGDNGSPVSRSP
jgi:hypothetical protein